MDRHASQRELKLQNPILAFFYLPHGLDSILSLLQIHEYVPPNSPLPVCPLSVDTTASNAPTKRKSSFLTTLSRLASPPPRATPLPPLTSTTPEDEEEQPLAAPAVAAYLNTLANDQHVRVTRPWKRFVRVRTEDLQSTRVERAIKRVRSDVAMHTSTAGITSPPPLPPSTGPSSIMSVEAVPPPAPAPHEEEGEPLVSQEVLDAIETGTKPEDKSPPQARPTSPQTHLHPHPQLQPQMETPTSTQVVSPTPVHSDPKPVRMEDLEPVPAEQPDMDGPQLEQEEQQEKEKEKEHPTARIPRSLSADPDKAARLSRMFTQPPAHEAAPRSGTETETETETEGEGGETDIQTDANAQSDATNGASQRDKTTKKKKKKVAHARKSSRKVVIDDFEMMRVLGKGCAGKVLLVRQKASNELYALKAITKKHVLAHQELQHTLTEQAVLKRMAHEGTDPFVVRLWWSFHDRENLFLVMVRYFSLLPFAFVHKEWMTDLRRTGLPPRRRPRYPARAMGPAWTRPRQVLRRGDCRGRRGLTRSGRHLPRPQTGKYTHRWRWAYRPHRFRTLKGVPPTPYPACRHCGQRGG